MGVEISDTVLGADNVLIEKYASDFSVPREVARIVARRFPGYGEAQRFLFPDTSQLHEPGLMPDIGDAARQILGAIRKGEGILIYTHDDVDGYASAAVMHKTLIDIARRGDTVHVYPIVREQDGYVLNPQVLKSYYEKGARLLLTVDFGISNEENFRIAEQEGLKAVICDHHETQLGWFSAPAVDPKRQDSKYPFRDLAGVGVAYKLAQFLYQQFFKITPGEFYSLKKSFFPIVGIGTLADRVVLRDENRIFCTYGMQLMDQADDPWLVCLRQEGEVTVSRLLKEVVPALGSAAYADPRLGVDFFIEGDIDRVKECYLRLRATDQQRRAEIDALFSEVIRSAAVGPRLALAMIELSKQHYLGSIAARLRDYFKRNSIIIGIKDEKCIGELRSCDFDLYKLLSQLCRYFIDFGGHQKAAGFSMEKRHLGPFLEEFKQHLEHSAPDIINGCDPVMPEPEAFLNRTDIGMLRTLMPFGEGNPAPVLIDDLGIYAVDNSLNIVER
ncbi:DHH family phosphoesterase [candidate division WOR-3 bacterium]|nr:DHH family phosphoesterase [candidate division WOR-3 bacterium]